MTSLKHSLFVVSLVALFVLAHSTFASNDTISIQATEFTLSHQYNFYNLVPASSSIIYAVAMNASNHHETFSLEIILKSSDVPLYVSVGSVPTSTTHEQSLKNLFHGIDVYVPESAGASPVIYILADSSANTNSTGVEFGLRVVVSENGITPGGISLIVMVGIVVLGVGIIVAFFVLSACSDRKKSLSGKDKKYEMSHYGQEEYHANV